jgi:hypothetical protein
MVTLKVTRRGHRHRRRSTARSSASRLPRSAATSPAPVSRGDGRAATGAGPKDRRVPPSPAASRASRP